MLHHFHISTTFSEVLGLWKVCARNCINSDERTTQTWRKLFFFWAGRNDILLILRPYSFNLWVKPIVCLRTEEKGQILVVLSSNFHVWTSKSSLMTLNVQLLINSSDVHFISGVVRSAQSSKNKVLSFPRFKCFEIIRVYQSVRL